MSSLNTQRQQELFEEFVIKEKRKGGLFGALKFKKPIFPQHRLSLSASYESLIIVLIGLVLAATVIFSLGVERGRNLKFSQETSADLAQKTETASAAVVAEIKPQTAEGFSPAAEEPVVKQGVKTPEPPVPTTGFFTIQVASYNKREMAEAELSRLKGKGYGPLEIQKRGKYFILCVGAYADKEKAKAALKDLERTYKGSYVIKR